MARNIAAIIALVLIVAGGIGLEMYSTHTLGELETRLDKIESNGVFSLEKTEETMAWWKKKTKVLEMFLLHEPLHEIDLALAEIKGAILYEPQDAGIALTKAKTAKEILLERHKLSISNVF